MLSETAGHFGAGLSEGVGKERPSSFHIFISQASAPSCLLSFGLGKVSVFLWVFLEEWKNESEAWLSVNATPQLLSTWTVWWLGGYPLVPVGSEHQTATRL